MNQLKAGGSQEVQPPGTLHGPVGLSSVCIEAICRAFAIPSVSSGPQGAVPRLQRPSRWL
jgi:hypothetical protein